MKFLLTVFALFLSACSVKNYESTQSKLITIKTPKLKFSDLGYVRNTQDAVELELFMAGKSAFLVAFDRDVCTHEGCMSRAAFNQNFLSAAYPDRLLQNVILGKPIYDAVALHKTTDGFIQKLANHAVNITYRVTSKEIYFRDAKNRILIKIKEIE